MTDLGADHFERWREDEATAEAMIPLMGRLYRDNDVILYIFGKKLTRTSIEIMKAHRYARNFIDASCRSKRRCRPRGSHDDAARLGQDRHRKACARLPGADTDDLEAYLHDELSSVMTGHGRLLEEPTDVVLYGFGRIGRLLARILIERAGSGAKLRLRAIVLRPQKENDIEKRASLLRQDSIHGPFNGTVIADPENDQIIVNGNPIRVIYAEQPEDIDYTGFGIHDAIVIDNTGAWRDKNGLSRHLQANGASAPCSPHPGRAR